MNLYAFFFC
ncbi:unnamed protein product [Acanthoscelides obtectus]|uniref:Uncharacterized protein n=1 Tax=Acanthoscelides obtectus TaxID=200917 RepID=A0A9P0QH20_ACAOB|nr:unnamed protein product [Acanthoscelides obtectus]